MLSAFTARFAEQSKRLDDSLLYENDANKQLLTEKYEKEAQRGFRADLETIGQELSNDEFTALLQFMLDRSYDLRIQGSYTIALVAANSENLFAGMRADAAEEAAAEEAKSIEAPTTEQKAPTRVLIAGNRTVTTHRREGDEGIPREQMAELTPDKLDKATLKRLKHAAGVSRRENMDPRAEQALDTGERAR